MMIYIDMDGVLAKWQKATYDEMIKPGFFLGRERERIIVSLVKTLIAIGCNVCILSAVLNEKCAKEKSIWLDNIFGKDLNRIFVPDGSNKADYIIGGKSILIDDYTKNLKAWKDSGNIPIKFYNGINGTKGTYNGASIHKNMSVGAMIEIIAEAVNQAA